MIKLQGFFNIYKPPGLTSFDVIRQLKKRFSRKSKIGHLGTLDPMATGVLPVAVGNATRVIEYVADSNKAYIAAFILGAVSDTQDAWGNITVLNDNIICNEAELRQVMEQFKGSIEQIPPMYSAVHHNGQRLYELARQGVEVERTPRMITIEVIELLDIDQSGKFPRVTIKVTCSKGTYIRTLVHDIGARMGTGAYLTSLVRVRTGDFCLDEAVPLQELLAAEDMAKYLLPIDYPLRYMTAYELEEEQSLNVKQGKGIKAEGFMHQQKVRLYFKQQLTAIAYYDLEMGVLRPEKVFI
ncbi:MAG TPA: tRNA pseudouridine(55) synthase TruB [Syntrophomonadaceae bacterium]|nr:tRNA pseudouridine(55) synthase TruB [Syntrophomonadaceae bacterium]